MMVSRLATVDFWRWLAGGGSLAFFRHHLFSSSSSSPKSKLTVLSSFLLFLVVVAASLFAISNLLPLSSGPSTSSLSSSLSSSSSSSTLLSWFFSPSTSNNSFNSMPPPLPPPQVEEEKDDVAADPLPPQEEKKTNPSGVVSESVHGGYGDRGEHSSKNGPFFGGNATVSANAGNSTKNSTFVIATDSSSKNGSFFGGNSTVSAHAGNSTKNSTFVIATNSSSKNGPFFEGNSTVSAHAGNSTKNSTFVITTDKSGGGEASGEVAIGKSFAPQSTPPNVASSCDGALDQPVVRNSTIKGVCFKGQILEKKSGISNEDHQLRQQQQQQQQQEQQREVNQGGGGGGRLKDSVEKTAPAAVVERNVSLPSVEVKTTGGLSTQCDIFNGRWVRDEGDYPYYPAGSCPYLDDDFNCHKNGRPDSEFLNWRWQPYDCDIPRLNATDFLGRLRGKRLVFVGDSLNRNMWESLVCILRHSISNKQRVYEVSGRSQFKTKNRKKHFKTRSYYSFRFEDYQCSVDFVRSPFLVREVLYKTGDGSEDERLRLDIMDEITVAYHEADVIVFNTGHWWTHEKTSRGINYYQERNHVYPVLKVMEAYKKALTTWSRWIDKNIDSSKTQVIFRGYSLTHFRGGQWNSGGQCHKETEPIFNQSYLAKYPSKMRVLEQTLKQMRTPVIYLNISRLTDYRKDGHPSIYRKRYDSMEELIAAEKSQDCSHWCLPGIPDSWNELLYASLLIAGKGSWRR